MKLDDREFAGEGEGEEWEMQGASLLHIGMPTNTPETGSDLCTPNCRIRPPENLQKQFPENPGPL